MECSHRGFGADRPLSPLIRNLPHWWPEAAFKFKSAKDEDFIFSFAAFEGGRDKKI